MQWQLPIHCYLNRDPHRERPLQPHLTTKTTLQHTADVCIRCGQCIGRRFILSQEFHDYHHRLEEYHRCNWVPRGPVPKSMKWLQARSFGHERRGVVLTILLRMNVGVDLLPCGSSPPVQAELHVFLRHLRMLSLPKVQPSAHLACCPKKRLMASWKLLTLCTCLYLYSQHHVLFLYQITMCARQPQLAAHKFRT
jgi:hypothetical protein